MSSLTVQYSSKDSSESNRKKTVGLTLRQDLLSAARASKINLSKLLENSLIQLLEPQPLSKSFSLSEGSLSEKRKFCAPIAQRLEQRFRKPSEWESFRAYLLGKHKKAWASELFRLAMQYHDLENNLSMLDSFSRSKKAKVLQSLIALAKFCGYYEDLKARLKSHGVKWKKASSLDAFLRIRNNQNGKVLEWLKQARAVLGLNGSVFLEFAQVSGLRTSEAIESFNLIIKLSHEGKLEEYYNETQKTLEHFAYPRLFLRQTKNAFISIMPRNLIEKMSQCTPVTYNSLKMKLQRKGLALQFDELRDYYGSFMVQHGLIREEVDLLQGRIGESIFTRHYFSPSFIELRDRTLKAVEGLKAQA